MHAFEIHCHTYYSRGTKIPWEGLPSPEDVIRKAKSIGLSGIAVTDHGNTKSWERAKKEAKNQDIVFIPGEEIETRQGHVTALGISEHIKNGLSVPETIDLVHEQGGIAVAVHPYDMRGFGIKDLFLKADAVEVFNALSLDRVSNWFTRKKAEGSGMPMVAGSDAHSLEMIGYARNIARDAGLDSFLKEIKKGEIKTEYEYVPLALMNDWIRQRFINSYADVISYINTRYSMPKAWLAKNMIRRYIVSTGSFWNALGKLGIVFSSVYAGLKVFSYC